MKTIEAPEKIYVPTAGDELHYHMTCPNNEFQESIEYTRTDAFIEKACKWIKDFCNEHYIMSYSDSHEVGTKELMEIFIKKMNE